MRTLGTLSRAICWGTCLSLASVTALAQTTTPSFGKTIYSKLKHPDDELGDRAGYESPYTNAAYPALLIGAAQQRGAATAFRSLLGSLWRFSNMGTAGADPGRCRGALDLYRTSDRHSLTCVG